MALDMNQLAAELGIDPATLSAKADVVSKYNTYFQEANTRYETATRAQQEAEAKLAQVQSEQAAINEQIAKFGMTEANVAALRANNAAMEASLKAIKEQGFDVNIPAPVAVPTQAAPEFDPQNFRQQVNQTLIEGFNANNRYQRLFGKALPEDVDVLAREAAQQRKPFSQYVAEKYDFAGEEKRQSEAAMQKRLDEYAASKLKEYQEKNPVVAGNPNLAPGVQSRAPHIFKPREESERRQFSNMGFREKIANSVKRTQEMIKQQAS